MADHGMPDFQLQNEVRNRFIKKKKYSRKLALFNACLCWQPMTRFSAVTELGGIIYKCGGIYFNNNTYTGEGSAPGTKLTLPWF